MADNNQNQPEPEKKKERKFNQGKYDFLISCSKKGEEGIKEWNKWREQHPDEEIHLEDVELHYSHLENVVLRGAHLENANLSFAHLENANLTGAHLENAGLQEAHLENAGLRVAHLENADLGGAHLENADLTFSCIKGTNFAAVKFNRKTRCLDMTIADYQGSALFKRHIDDQQYLNEFKNKSIYKKIIYYIWLITCSCGRSFLLWAFWSIVMVVGFSLIYYKLGHGAFSVPWLPWNIMTTFYYSVVTFTTLGFGDIVPKTNAASLWIMMEVIIGYIMLGGLISIFASKLARRS